jgi:hypothetical protein
MKIYEHRIGVAFSSYHSLPHRPSQDFAITSVIMSRMRAVLYIPTIAEKEMGEHTREYIDGLGRLGLVKYRHVATNGSSSLVTNQRLLALSGHEAERCTTAARSDGVQQQVFLCPGTFSFVMMRERVAFAIVAVLLLLVVICLLHWLVVVGLGQGMVGRIIWRWWWW